MIKVQFEYKIEEVRDGIRGIQRSSGAYWRAGAICAAAIVLVMVWNRFDSTSPPPDKAVSSRTDLAPPWAQYLPLAMVICIGGPMAFKLLQRAGVGKKHPFLGRLWTLEIDQELVTMSDASQRTERRWLAFRKFVETKKVFLLFTDRNIVMIVPKRVLDPLSTDEFRQLVNTHIKLPNRLT